MKRFITLGDYCLTSDRPCQLSEVVPWHALFEQLGEESAIIDNLDCAYTEQSAGLP